MSKPAAAVLRARPWFAIVLAIAAPAGCGAGDHERTQSATTTAPTTTTPGPRPDRAERGARFALQRIGRFNQPVYLTQAPGDARRLFVVEKRGRIKVVRGGRTLRRPFLSLRGQVSTATEQGLLGLAFSPAYQRTRRFYVAFTDRRGILRVEEFRRSRRSADVANEGTRRLVLAIRSQPEKTHNGGSLVFGPDERLYIGVGDGGGPRDPKRTAQNRSLLLGKVLRIDPRRRGRHAYSSPESNPFVRRRGMRDEVWAYGLRNPWRFSFDRKTGALVLGDVGQEAYEEIDYRPRGKAAGTNFGWSAYEGNHRLNRRVHARGNVRPIHTYGRDNGCAVIAGYVVRDPALPRMRGRLLYGDFCTGDIRSLIPRAPRARDPRREHVHVQAMSSFGEDLRGRIYVTSLAGPVYRLVPPKR
jgi:glucose/arabinose dehydrogenase